MAGFGGGFRVGEKHVAQFLLWYIFSISPGDYEPNDNDKAFMNSFDRQSKTLKEFGTTICKIFRRIRYKSTKSSSRDEAYYRSRPCALL